MLTHIKHPLIEHKLSRLRDRNTQCADFRTLMEELARLLAYEATKDLALKEVAIETPLTATRARVVEQFPTVVSVMRAGNGMLEGILSLLPMAPAGHIGIYRDKFIKNTVEYFFKVPERAKGGTVLLADPLLATGDSAIACLDRLKQFGVKRIKMLCLLVSPEGVERVSYFHPDVEVYTLSVEEGLDSEGRLLPGVGDAGNRLYNTKS